MRNLDPHSGLKQIITGSFPVARFEIVELVRRNKLTPLELGYFLIFLSSADWDKDKYRCGYVRLELHKLSKIWNTPLSTLRDNLNKLIKKNVMVIGEDGVPKIINFPNFTLSGSSTISKTKYSDDFVEEYFDNSFPKTENSSSKNEISLNSKQISPFSFRDSIKDDLEVSSGMEYVTKTDIFHQQVKSDSEYQRIYKEGNWGPFTSDDMKWVDQNTKWKQENIISDTEKDVIDTIFDGDTKKYKDCLINQ